jgi:hypothetical protein
MVQLLLCRVSQPWVSYARIVEYQWVIDTRHEPDIPTQLGVGWCKYIVGWIGVIVLVWNAVACCTYAESHGIIDWTRLRLVYW